MSVQPVQSHRTWIWKGCTLGLMLRCHHLEACNFDRGSPHSHFALGPAYYVANPELVEWVRGLELQPNPCANQNWLARHFHMSAMSCEPFYKFIHLLIQQIFTGHVLCTGHSFRCWRHQSKQTKSLSSCSSHSPEGDWQGRGREMLWVAVQIGCIYRKCR